MVATMVNRLHGKNQIRRFRQVADELASQIATYEGIAGIVFIGGLVRGFIDKRSDLDIVVFLDKNDMRLEARIHEIGLKGERDFHIDIDLEVHFLGDFKKWKWDEADRWEFSKAETVFDPRGEVREVFSQKLALSKDFWLKRIAVYTEYLKWYCCPQKENVGTISEAWIERGDLPSAHYCLSYGVDLIMKTLFALNREFLPAPKWRLFYSRNLRWLPGGYERLVKRAMIINEFSVKEYNRRSTAIRNLWERLSHRIEEETGLSMAQLSGYYVEQILHQKGIPNKH